MKRRPALSLSDIDYVLYWTLLYRMVSVSVVMFTVPMRHALPAWMAAGYQRWSYPLFAYAVVSFLFRKQLASFLQNRPAYLYPDLLISVAVLFLGGSWRSSYFAYTVTTIMLFTAFDGKRGAYVSALVLTAIAVIKDPSGGLPTFDIFYIDDWDMQVGAAFFYGGTGLIFGYFHTLLLRLETLSREKIEETRKLAVLEEKNRMALELHDGAKQMINAVLMKMNLVVRKFRNFRDETTDELRWLWRAMHFLKAEMNQVMSALRKPEDSSAEECSLLPIIEEEARIAEVMTDFSWHITAEPRGIAAPLRSQTALRRFLGEVFMNAWKHSGVEFGSVSVRSSDTAAVIAITDAGKGFHYSGDGFSTMGLKSLKHRARELNGELTIRSAPGEGCRVVLTLPLECNNLRSHK